MTRLKGKVISRPVQVPKAGQQLALIISDKLCIGTIEDNQDLAWYHSNPSGGSLTIPTKHRDTKGELKELCIEYKVETPEPWRDWKSVVVPLKYSQWQAAIDNGEVDSDKTVEFEIAYMNGGYSNTGTPPSKMAKIIPAKKKVYTEDEVIKLLDAYATYSIRTIDELTELPEDWLKKYSPIPK